MEGRQGPPKMECPASEVGPPNGFQGSIHGDSQVNGTPGTVWRRGNGGQGGAWASGLQWYLISCLCLPAQVCVISVFRVACFLFFFFQSGSSPSPASLRASRVPDLPWPSAHSSTDSSSRFRPTYAVAPNWEISGSLGRLPSMSVTGFHVDS